MKKGKNCYFFVCENMVDVVWCGRGGGFFHLRNMSYRIWTSVSLKAGLYIGTEMNKILSFILYERVFYSNPFFQINPDIGKPFMPTA